MPIPTNQMSKLSTVPSGKDELPDMVRACDVKTGPETVQSVRGTGEPFPLGISGPVRSRISVYARLWSPSYFESSRLGFTAIFQLVCSQN
jgi:hypothetical protein